jgi:hypothetical protein
MNAFVSGTKPSLSSFLSPGGEDKGEGEINAKRLNDILMIS